LKLSGQNNSNYLVRTAQIIWSEQLKYLVKTTVFKKNSLIFLCYPISAEVEIRRGTLSRLQRNEEKRQQKEITAAAAKAQKEKESKTIEEEEEDVSSEVSSEDLEEYMDSVFQVVSRGKDDILELTIYDDTLTESMSDLSNSNIGKDDDEELFHPHEKDKVSIGIRRSRKTLSEVSSDLLLSKH
jgi:hypothetical protein